MQYLVIEKFLPGKIRDLYQRLDEKGRMLPAGVRYINSWISKDVTVCYQVMESDSAELLMEWMDQWKNFVNFELIPVISSDEAKKLVFSRG